MISKPIVIDKPHLLTEQEVAKIVGISTSTLRGQRIKGTGLPYLKFPNGRILYEPEDVKNYVQAIANGKKVYPK